MNPAGCLVAAALVAAAGCSGSSNGPTPVPSANSDAAFVQLASHNQKLAGEDRNTLVTLGHEVCDLLSQHHGNAAPVDRFLVTTAGNGGRAFFTPTVLSDLRRAATSAYCPRWS